MANVRIDENGVPKGAVFEATTPIAHRTDVTAVDEGDPASLDDGVDAEGYEHIDFDIDVTLGGDDPMVEVAPLYYDAAAEDWFRGESTYFLDSGRRRLRVEARGAVVFLQVVSLTGDTPTLSLSAWASLRRGRTPPHPPLSPSRGRGTEQIRPPLLRSGRGLG